MTINFKYYFFFLVLSSISCGKDREYIEKNLTLSFDIPTGLNTIESHYFQLGEVNMFLDETLKINNLPVDQTYEISGAKCLLTSRLSGADFSVIDRISVFAVDRSNPNKRIEIFYNENIPLQSISNIRLLASISNVTPYIKDNRMKMEVRIRFRGFMVAPVIADLDFSYIVYRN
jgi:hypothetical protein